MLPYASCSKAQGTLPLWLPNPLVPSPGACRGCFSARTYSTLGTYLFASLLFKLTSLNISILIFPLTLYHHTSTIPLDSPTPLFAVLRKQPHTLSSLLETDTKIPRNWFEISCITSSPSVEAQVQPSQQSWRQRRNLSTCYIVMIHLFTSNWGSGCVRSSPLH